MPLAFTNPPTLLALLPMLMTRIVGVAYTENESVVFSLKKLKNLCQISCSKQILDEEMLSPVTATNLAKFPKSSNSFMPAFERIRYTISSTRFWHIFMDGP